MTDVDELLGHMTLEEKCAQLAGVWLYEIVDEMFELDPAKMAGVLSHGIGHISRISSQTGAPPERTADLANRIQRHLVEETRLGIPAIVHEESTGGFCARQATQFPHGPGLAASWDPELVEEVAEVIGRQLRAVGARVTLAPVVDIARDPRWGRVEETFGEDPELASRTAVAYVRGVQSQGVQATLKHWVGHGAHEGGLNHAWVHSGPRHLRDVLAAPFRAAINEAGVGNVMPAYNEIDGLPIHGSRELLTDLLRDELGFEGVTVADYFGVTNLIVEHHVAADNADAARQALLAGLDVELPAYDAYRHLPELVESGAVPVEAIDTACRRVLAQKVELGLFDDPYVDAEAAAATFDTPEDRALARRAVAASITLLTNDGTLPLAAGQKVAVLGPSADDPRLFLGDYHFPSHVRVAAGREDLPQNPTPTVLEVLRERVDLVDLEVADVAVICVGGRSGLAREDTSGEFRDVTDLRLAPEQLALIEETAGRGIPMVVVVIGGRVHSLTEVVEHANAVVMAWLPGEEGGNGIVDVLCGDVDAGGRLPVTILRNVGQVGATVGAHHGGGRSEIYGDYVDSPVAPLFPFGHGLSYTTWERSDLSVTAGSTTDELTISVTTTNTGDRAGVDVVQVLFTDELASVGLPASRLLAFRRVEADPGESVTVTSRVPAGRLGFTDADLRYRVEPGEFTFRVGDLAETVTLDGETVFPDRNGLAPVGCTLSG
jgi:beta-glucosidase-like glycosyl hydrolase